jgi:hypothetical protein
MKQAHPIEAAIKDIRELAYDHGLMDCEIRSIFNMGLTMRYQFGGFAEQWAEDKKMRDQKETGWMKYVKDEPFAAKSTDASVPELDKANLDSSLIFNAPDDLIDTLQKEVAKLLNDTIKNLLKDIQNIEVSQFDGKEFVKDVVIKAINEDYAFKQSVKG